MRNPNPPRSQAFPTSTYTSPTPQGYPFFCRPLSSLYDKPIFFSSPQSSHPISSFITLPDLHCPVIHLPDLHCPFIHLPDFHCCLIPLPDLHCPSILHHLYLLDLLLQLHLLATLLDDIHHHGPQPSPSPTWIFTQRTAAPLGLSLPPSPGPFYTIYTLSILYIPFLYYIYPPILYMLPPPSWTLSALPDPLFPPNPHRLPTFLYYIYLSIIYIPFYTIYFYNTYTFLYYIYLSIIYIPFYTIYFYNIYTFLYYIYLSILYILSSPSRILTAFHPDPHHPPFAPTDVLRRPPDFLFFLTSIAIYLSYVAHHLFSILQTIYHATYN